MPCPWNLPQILSWKKSGFIFFLHMGKGIKPVLMKSQIKVPLTLTNPWKSEVKHLNGETRLSLPTSLWYRPCPKADVNPRPQQLQWVRPEPPASAATCTDQFISLNLTNKSIPALCDFMQRHFQLSVFPRTTRRGRNWLSVNRTYWPARWAGASSSQQLN